MGLISRGFLGRRRSDVPAGRLPPGQYVVNDFPVLSAGPTPRVPLDEWRFTITGMGAEEREWGWEEFLALPSRGSDGRYPLRHQVVQARHHVARRLGRHAAERDRKSACVRAGHSYGGYTTNLPLADLTGGRAWVAYDFGG